MVLTNQPTAKDKLSARPKISLDKWEKVCYIIYIG